MAGSKEEEREALWGRGLIWFRAALRILMIVKRVIVKPEALITVGWSAK